MKTIVIFRHIACEGPGYLADFLDKHQLNYKIICVDEGEPIPATLDNISGIVFLGGPMSVNDNLPWIEPELALIKNAQQAGLPILGHCLGAQLISKALGGTIEKNPVQEIGWFNVSQHESCLSSYWLDDLAPEFDAFHMHGEKFSIPAGAALLLKSQFCDHQAFSIGNTLALQFHIEVTEDLINEWVSFYKDDIASTSVSVQSSDEIINDLKSKIDNVNKIADKLYTRWIDNL